MKSQINTHLFLKLKIRSNKMKMANLKNLKNKYITRTLYDLISKMKPKRGGLMSKRFLSIIFILLFAFILGSVEQSVAQRERPPEYKEITDARKLETPKERLKAFEAIKKKYPESQYAEFLDRMILSGKIELSDSIDKIVKLQKETLAKAEGAGQITEYLTANSQILGHEKVSKFNNKKLLKTVQGYVEIGKKNVKDPQVIESIRERSRDYYKGMGKNFDVQLATAYILTGDVNNGSKYLDDYVKAGGAKDGEYYYRIGQLHEVKGNDAKAFDAFFASAGLDYKIADGKAEELYKKINGNTTGFDSKLEAKKAELPFHPKTFKPSSKWTGKTALIELFTGSECPPCVAADLGFDGLLEAFDGKYAIVLEYHLPIPRPDPMMNPATKLRAEYYGARSTPTTLFEGEKKLAGGGGKGNAEKKYNDYSAEVKNIIAQSPSVKLKVNASLKSDVVKVTWSSDNKPENVDYNFALVQEEVKHKGGNGVAHHKMVVRDFMTLGTQKTVVFNLVESEKMAETYLHDYEKEKDFKFEVLQNKIDRAQLKVVFFVQDKETKKILNAVICDVKS
jgi:thiol-disulfide isomerase/thioredoxin